jgi:hypothetical protein
VVVRVAFHGPDGVVELLVDEGEIAVTARCPGALLPAPGGRVGVRVNGEATLDGEHRDGGHDPDTGYRLRPTGQPKG